MLKFQWYTRRIYARSTDEMFLKMAAWSSCEAVTGKIELQVLPLWWNVEAENYSRIIRIKTDVGPRQLADWADEIEKKVAAYYDEWQRAKNERKVIDLTQY